MSIPIDRVRQPRVNRLSIPRVNVLAPPLKGVEGPDLVIAAVISLVERIDDSPHCLPVKDVVLISASQGIQHILH